MIFLTVVVPVPSATIFNLRTNLYRNWIRDTRISRNYGGTFVRPLQFESFPQNTACPTKPKTPQFHMCGIRGVRARRNKKFLGMESYGGRKSSARRIWTPILKIPLNEEKAQKCFSLHKSACVQLCWSKGHFELSIWDISGVHATEELEANFYKESGVEQFLIEKKMSVS